MKIDVIQREFELDGSVSRSFKICDCKYCCDGIKHFPNINFFYRTTENTDNPFEDEYGYGFDLGIMLQRSVTYHDPWEYDSYGFTEEYYYKLNYCPVCGEKIEIDIVDNVDISKEYASLYNEREEISKKHRKTNSISRRDKYIKQIRELDKQLELLYRTDTLPGKENIYED